MQFRVCVEDFMEKIDIDLGFEEWEKFQKVQWENISKILSQTYQVQGKSQKSFFNIHYIGVNTEQRNSYGYRILIMNLFYQFHMKLASSCISVQSD